jgi:plasmid stability protein
MAQVVVRSLEEDIKSGLKRRARRHGHSMEEEIRQILRDAVKQEGRGVRRLGSRISARFSRLGLPAKLPELRGAPARSARFDS